MSDDVPTEFSATLAAALAAELTMVANADASGLEEAPPITQVELDDRGSIGVRYVPAPPGRPTLALLHGWTATADLNWFRCYGPLSTRFGVVAFDHRGHGAGLRMRRGFQLEDCADDAADVLAALGIERAIAVGYSMGGTIAQLLWRRHPARISGLALCATAAHFADSREERLSFLGLSGLAAIARITPAQARDWLTGQFYLQRKSADWEDWAAEQMASHDWRMILEAGRAIGQFSAREWLGEVDVPTAVVATTIDRVIPLRRQVELFRYIPGADAFRVHAGHDAVVAEPTTFVPALLRALDSIEERMR